MDQVRHADFNDALGFVNFDMVVENGRLPLVFLLSCADLMKLGGFANPLKKKKTDGRLIEIALLNNKILRRSVRFVIPLHS